MQSCHVRVSIDKCAPQKTRAGTLRCTKKLTRASYSRRLFLPLDIIKLRLQLAESLAAAGNYEESLESCLLVVKQDPGELREQARQLMVDMFKLLPDDSDLTREYRRQLSMALY